MGIKLVRENIQSLSGTSFDDYNFYEQDYFLWMCSLVCDNYQFNQYTKLLNHLNNIDFIALIEMDKNLIENGLDFRYRYGYENAIPRDIIEKFLMDKKVSVLEIMVSLSFNCEEKIMSDPEIGDRTGLWFWTMIENLRLEKCQNILYNEVYIDSVIDRLLNRNYDRSGYGGLFPLKRHTCDLREVDIWYQMMWYLTENYDFSI